MLTASYYILLSKVVKALVLLPNDHSTNERLLSTCIPMLMERVVAECTLWYMWDEDMHLRTAYLDEMNCHGTPE